MASDTKHTRELSEAMEARVRAHAGGVPGSKVPYSVNARLATRQYAVLLQIAELHDVSISEALRIALEELVPKYFPDENLQRLAVSVEPDPEWAAKHGQGE
jgi:hypothetical protein